jgi:hypothetical protein
VLRLLRASVAAAAGPLLAIELQKTRKPPAGLAPEFHGPIYEENLTQFHLRSLQEQLKQVGALAGSSAVSSCVQLGSWAGKAARCRLQLGRHRAAGDTHSWAWQPLPRLRRRP